MLDMNYLWINIHCPKCNYEIDVQIIDAKSEKNIICNNCKVSIQLQDSNASVHNGIESVNNALTDLQNFFNK